MVGLGLEVADAVLVNWVTPAHVPRSPTAARVLCYVRCGLTPGAAPRLRQELGHYRGVGAFERHVERMGVAPEETCVLAPDAPSLQAGIAAFDQVLDETIVRAVTATDEPDDLLELLHACAPASSGRH
jgi:hypothetical protein